MSAENRKKQPRKTSEFRIQNSEFNQWTWNCTKVGVSILPLISGLGTLILLIAVLRLWLREYRRIIKYPLNWGWALLSVWLIFTTCFAFKPLEAWLGLANFLPFFAVLAAFTLLMQKPSHLRELAWCIVLSSFPVVILGLGQLFGGWESPPICSYIGVKLVPHGNPDGRMSSVFMYANSLAAYLLIVFIIGLGLWIERYQAWRQQLYQVSKQMLNIDRQNLESDSDYQSKIQNPKSKMVFKPYPGWLWGLLSLVVISDVVGLLLTDSRNAWAIAFFACLAFALYLGWRWFILGALTFAGSIVWASWGPNWGRQRLRQIVPAYFWERLSDELYPDRAIATLRTSQWHFALEMIQQRPWLGWGMRNFTPLYKAKMGIFLGHPHSLYLMLLAETGIPATLFLCALVGSIMVQAIGLLGISALSTPQQNYDWQKNSLMLLTYLLAFGSCTLFNILDVTIFDLRMNLLGWLLLSALSGVVYGESEISSCTK